MTGNRLDTQQIPLTPRPTPHPKIIPKREDQQAQAGRLFRALLGVGVTASWTTPAGMIAGTALLALGVTFSTPAFFSAVFATAAPSQRGAASGTASAFLDLGLGGGPILLGLVAQSACISFAFAVAAGIALAGSAWTMSLGRFLARQGNAARS
jgi:predicted MFS family arabinose efflux permease